MSGQDENQLPDADIYYSDLRRRLTLTAEEVASPSAIAVTVLQADPLDSGIPSQLPDVQSLYSPSNSSIPFSWGAQSPGKVSPLRGRTMKEYEEQLSSLKKENFSLKLRIYFLEERMAKKYDKDKEELIKINIKLKVEMEALKEELYNKQELVREASTALSSLEQQFQEQVAQLKQQHQEQQEKLHTQLAAAHKELEEKGAGGDLTLLCDLAFSAPEDQQQPAPQPAKSRPHLTLNLPSYDSSSTTPSSLQGLFSLPAEVPQPAGGQGAQDQEQLSPWAGEKVEALQAQVDQLEAQVRQLQAEVEHHQQDSVVLQGDVDNLRRELEEKVDKVVELEQEVVDKDQKLDEVLQELETRHQQIQHRDHQIQSLHHDLTRVEPEMEVKVQEIIERDRIIQEKIEQIEQQNKIMVEIQITLEEKQKQISDLEQKVIESADQVTKLTQDLEKSHKVIKVLAEQVQKGEQEVVGLKKELMRKERKIRDLVAELKEALDMFNKAKWEAETSGSEDGVKEMAEEENERLWAELESRKKELQALRGEHQLALTAAEERLADLRKQLEEKVAALEAQGDQHSQERQQQEAALRDKCEQVARLEGQLGTLREDMASREGQLRINQGMVEGLQQELATAQAHLKEKKEELELVRQELRKKDWKLQDLVGQELQQRNREVDRLHHRLSAALDHMHQGEDTKGEPKTEQEAATCAREQCLTVGVVASGAGPQWLLLDQQSGRPTTGQDETPSLQVLYKEVGQVRQEAQALKVERGLLANQLAGLQHLYHQMCQAHTQPTFPHPHTKLGGEERKLLSDPTSHAQAQLRLLRDELQAAQSRVEQQVGLTSWDECQKAFTSQTLEIARLRQRLTESHTNCDLLRTRLEDLAHFLQRILELEEKGLIDLSQLSGVELSSLQHTLDDSRALSQSLMDASNLPLPDYSHTSTFIHSLSCHSVAREDSLCEPPEQAEAGSQGNLLAHDEDLRAQASLLTSFLDSRITQVDAIAEELRKVGGRLQQQAGLVLDLQGQILVPPQPAEAQHTPLSARTTPAAHGSQDSLWEPLPPPVLQDSAAEARPVRVERGQARSEGGGEQCRGLVSPSESEAWSEPDRKVSLARMGLAVATLGGDLSPAPPRQHRAASPTSESDWEAPREDGPAPSPGKTGKRRWDVGELRRLSTRLRAVEQLNQTLMAELSTNQSLGEQHSLAQQQRPSTSDKSVETVREQSCQATHQEPPTCRGSLPPVPLMQEIRALKVKLEEAISNNDQLRDQLETALGSQPSDQPCHTALEEAQEEVCQVQHRLQLSQQAAQELHNRCQKVQQQLEEQEAQWNKQLEAAHLETAAVKDELHALQQLQCDRTPGQQALEQQLAEKQLQLGQLQEKLSKLEQQLQEQEGRLLQVNKDRLSLVGERARLQAQLASASSEARLLHESPVLLTLLQQEQSMVASMQQDKLREVLREELAASSAWTVVQSPSAQDPSQQPCQPSQAQDPPQQPCQPSQAQDPPQQPCQPSQAQDPPQQPCQPSQAQDPPQQPCQPTQAQDLHHNYHQLLQEHQQLQHRANSLEGQLESLKRQQKTAEEAQLCLNEQRALMKQLTAQLEAERRLTANLQLQLRSLPASPTTSATSVDPCSGRTTSHESVTSIEYFQPEAEWPSYPCPWPAPHSPSLDLDRSGGGRERRGSSSSRGRRREKHHSREDKENLLITSSSTKRTYRSTSLPGGSAAPPPGEEDGGTTSGESPDLGIGSDHHFSSLERGSHMLCRSLPPTCPLPISPTSRPLPLTSLRSLPPNSLPPTSLCSEPSHGALSEENQQLRRERDDLSCKLSSTKDTLRHTLHKLSRANQRKEHVERAICRQLSKTHDVLKKTKSHLRSANAQNV